MAYYTRKKGLALWRTSIFKVFGFCLCCKNEVSPGEYGLDAKKGRRLPTGEMFRNQLCNECLKEWKSGGYIKPLCELTRFKIE